MKLVGDEFQDMTNYYGKEWWPAREVVEKAVEERFKVHASGRVIHLKGSGGQLPWKNHIFSIENSQGLNLRNNTLFVVYEDQNKLWNITSVPLGQLNSRCALPSAWWGLPETELRKVSGIKGIRFVHLSGFKGNTQSKEEVMEMVDKSLMINHCYKHRKNNKTFYKEQVKRREGQDPTTLYITNLPHNMTKEELRQKFLRCGEVSYQTLQHM